METVYVPNFLKESPDCEIFRRVEVFMNLSVKFTSKMRLGEDKSKHTMKALLEHPPLQGLTTMNEILNLLKDVVLTAQYNKLIGNERTHLPCQSTTPSAKITNSHLFSKDDLAIVSKLYRELLNSISEHQAIMDKLRDARKKFYIQNKKLESLTARAKETVEKHGMENELEDDTQNKSKDKTEVYLKTLETISRTQHKELVRQNDVAMKSLVRCVVFVNREKEMRSKTLKTVEQNLRSYVEFRITQALNTGCEHLVAFAKEFSIPEHVIKRLEEFDTPYIANKLYQQMATRYMYIYPDADCYFDDLGLPESSWEDPTLPFQRKHDIRLGRSESCVDLVNEDFCERRQEELYVWSCVDTKKQKITDGLKCAKGQMIKQKFCSSDGQVAFGWKRHVMGGPKTYGFYPTHHVSLVP